MQRDGNKKGGRGPPFFSQGLPNPRWAMSPPGAPIGSNDKRLSGEQGGGNACGLVGVKGAGRAFLRYGLVLGKRISILTHGIGGVNACVRCLSDDRCTGPVILGLSGKIDSCPLACAAVEGLGKGSVHLTYPYGRYSRKDQHGSTLAASRRLGVEHLNETCEAEVAAMGSKHAAWNIQWHCVAVRCACFPISG